nr:MAG TPA: hypothetical protein [Caudoviricetes sp.]
MPRHFPYSMTPSFSIPSCASRTLGKSLRNPSLITAQRQVKHGIDHLFSQVKILVFRK